MRGNFFSGFFKGSSMKTESTFTRDFFENRHWLRAISITLMNLEANFVAKFHNCTMPIVCFVAKGYLQQIASGLHEGTRTLGNSEVWSEEAFKVLSHYPKNLAEYQKFDTYKVELKINPSFISLKAMKAMMQLSVYLTTLSPSELSLVAQGISDRQISFTHALEEHLHCHYQKRAEDFISALALFELGERISNLSFEDKAQAHCAVKTAETMRRSEHLAARIAANWAIHCISYVDERASDVGKIKDFIKGL